jgi:hypothetical protein
VDVGNALGQFERQFGKSRHFPDPSWGAWLKRRRLDTGVSLEEIAAETRISVRYLVARKIIASISFLAASSCGRTSDSTQHT